MAVKRLPFLYEGQVTRRDDPEGLGRVKINVPGIVEPETPNWAEPLGILGGGHAQRGTFEPPRVGANVAVLFKLGEIDHPRYLVGPWGAPGGTSDVPTNGEVEGEDRQNAVTEDEEWRVERDSRSLAGHPKYEVINKSGDTKLLLNSNPLDKYVEIDSGGGQKLELKVTGQQAIVDSGFGPKLILDGTAQTVSLALGSGPKLELFAGGFALSAGSSPEFAALGGKAKVGDRNATEKMILGTAYRNDEATFLNALAAALHIFATAAKASTIDPVLAAAATALETAMAATPISDSEIRTDGSAATYLSQNVDVQD